MCEEEEWRFPFQYIRSVKSPDRHVLLWNREMRKAFQVHFWDCCPNLRVQEFLSYSANFPCLWEIEAVGCEGLVTESEVRNTMKQVSLNKSPGLDGLPYEVYLKLPHICAYSDGYVQPLVHPGSHPW